MNHQQPGRRTVLRAGALAGIAAAAGLAPNPAAAAPAASRPPRIVDLGPAVSQFSLMSAILVGDTVHIGSRNIEPVQIISVHLPTQKTVARTELPSGHSIQALAANDSGTYLYAGTLQKASGGQPNLFRWDLRTPDEPAEPLGAIGDRDVRALAVAPDGVVYAVGGGSSGAPALWEYDPATGEITNVGTPDKKVTLARAVAATRTHAFFGAGTTFNGGGDTSRAALYAYDRSAKTFTAIAPPQMLRDPSIRDLAVFGDRLAVSTAGSTQDAKVALMDLKDLSSYEVATSIGKVAKSFTMIGDTLYYANESGLLAYLPSTNTVSPIAYEGPELGEIWGVDSRAGKALVTSAFGFVAEIDLAKGSATVTELDDVGAPMAPQTVMGIAAGGGHVYVGGNATIARHTLGRDTVLKLRAPGEAKDAVVVNGVLYTGQYNSEGIWAHDPRTGRTRQVAAFPSEQNRPLDVTFDENTGLVLVGVQSDTEGGGALWTYHPRTGRHRSFADPVDDVQCVRGIATRNGIAFLGGDNTAPTGPRSTVVAFDPLAGRELWRIDPRQTAGTAALAVRGRHLYGLSRKGGIYVIDIPRRELIHRADITSVSNGFAALVTNRGVVYGVSDTTVFRLHPRTFAVSVVVPDIDGGWYSGAHITNDEHGRLYTMRGRNLVQITDHPGH
ncbi:Outer membrane protein assembly factor BamB, contains PQQ-like beta-propeller repeat [Streptomyces sp. MnatMP-M77]|uniref:outer membrane protein assembly factor BamB family protein n=1 Tax=unclassified Streptomyces TaxID=2593676 RepID=UPI000804F520|nr:PQQ-binding-like beta-propeller repeat protein [Streptomyces sp. MnatMP-M77]MYT77539.1 PQQ-binding-like beta-propeller repeat protein [Streptomyces sp. SID8364]SBU99404.1 Outer membrane protein assembly factor BamB, contains PQQ-like beta-propeller repeat [Streptomyces sp. MnatMP-M77]